MQLNEQQIIKEFIHLLKIPSPSQYERDVATYINERCKAMNIDVHEDQTTDETGSNVGNIICTIRGNCCEATPIYFTAHMDTVEKNQVHPIIDKQIITSDGTTALGADDKVGIIALLEAVHYLKETNQPHGDIQLLFTVCEEQGLVGARALDPSLLVGSIGYTVDADQSIGTFVTRSPAFSVGTITIEALNDQMTDEVNTAMSGVVRSIFTDERSETSSVSIIGFQENNETEQYAMDVRFQIYTTSDLQMGSYINTLKNKIATEFDDEQVNVYIDFDPICSSYNYTSADPVVELANRAAERVGIEPIHIERTDVSDANALTSSLKSTMNIGAGYERMHTTEEQIELAELYALVRLVISICLEARNG